MKGIAAVTLIGAVFGASQYQHLPYEKTPILLAVGVCVIMFLAVYLLIITLGRFVPSTRAEWLGYFPGFVAGINLGPPLSTFASGEAANLAPVGTLFAISYGFSLLAATVLAVRRLRAQQPN